MTVREVYERHLQNTFFTLVAPAGDDGNEILVLCDIKYDGNGGFIPCWKDITYCQPMYLHYSDLKSVFSEALLNFYNLWTISDIESLVDHQD